jgi:hypothetical protein
VESKVQKSERAFVGTDKPTEHAVVGAAAVWVGAGDSALEFPVFVGVGTGGFGDYGWVFRRRETE